MYAVIEAGGKQYRVTPGQVIKVEKLLSAVGEETEFLALMLVDGVGQLNVGTPYLNHIKVKATVLEHGRGKKIKIVKFRRRKHHRKQMGHRQAYTAVKIHDIS